MDNSARKNSPKNAEADRTARSESSDMSQVEMDKLIHERKRLAIISALAVNTKLSFSELKSLLDLSDGNLSVHAQKLETAGYIRCSKGFDGRTPKTTYAITAKGTKALEKYLNHMEQLIKSVRNAQE